MRLNPMPHSTEGMSHSPALKLLVVEASMMRLRPGFQFDRLYDDACDEGLALWSHKTGVVTTWYLEMTSTDLEHEVQYWLLKPTSESIYKVPALAGYALKIFND